MRTINKDIWFPAIFEDLFLENKIDIPTKFKTFSAPAVNIRQNLTSFVIELAAPGLKKDNFSIEIEEDTLKISAKKVIQAEEEEDKVNDFHYQKREFDYNDFTRSFKLPENINSEDIEASYFDGILKVSLPKLEEKKALKRMVEIS